MAKKGLTYDQLLGLANKYGFDSIRDWQNWEREKFNGKIIDERRQYNKEYGTRWFWEKGMHEPMSFNENCSSYFGIEIAEKYVCATFEDAIRMPNNTPGYDWVCKKGYKIQHKARCLSCNGRKFEFAINYNNIADYFMLTGWDNRIDLEPIYAWLIHKDEIIRGRKLWRRDKLIITNGSKYLIEFKKYEIADKLEELRQNCNNKVQI